jgi:excisionase family DNA binding protein
MARQAKDIAERKNFYLYIDEFQNFITESMTEILSGARKYGFGLILAHQELRQLWARDSELASSVIANPGTRVCFRLGDFDAKKLEDGFSAFDAQDLQNLGVGEAIARIERADYDFNLKTLPLPDVSMELTRNRRERLIELSREKYARPRKELDELLVREKEFAEDQKPAPALSAPLPSDAGVKKEKELAKKAAAERAEVLPEEKGFLEFIRQYSGMFVTKIYKTLGLSSYKGDKLKSDLIDKGLVVQQETRDGRGGRLAKVLALTDKGAEAAKKLTLRGKGGDLHKDLQRMIAEQAKVFGWQAVVEERIGRSLETVDVGLRKNDVMAAVEISDTTRPEQEVPNIRKCLEAGYDYILSVCPDDKDLSQLKTAVKKSFTFKERERIRFYPVSRVKDFLSGVGSPAIVSEKPIVSGQITKEKQLLDTAEASQLLGISRNTLYEWIVQRKIPYIKVGRLVKFRREDLQKWLEKRIQEEKRFDIIDE